jgi:hypothetical protein
VAGTATPARNFDNAVSAGLAPGVTPTRGEEKGRDAMALEIPAVAPGVWRRLFSFPNPVNEVSARLVAAGVVVMCILTITLGWRWATAVIAYGFLARVSTGPKLSPLGQFVTRALTPRLPFAERPVPGPPKRFAQGIGAVFSCAALVLALSGEWTPARVVLSLLAAAAFLESAFAICLGCKAFAMLMRAGVIPSEVCESCNDIWAHGPRPS